MIGGAQECPARELAKTWEEKGKRENRDLKRLTQQSLRQLGSSDASDATDRVVDVFEGCVE